MKINESAIQTHAQNDGVNHFATGIAVINDDGQVLIVQRAADDYLGGNFELPGGGVEAGESLVESAKRELFEETGLEMDKIEGLLPGFDYYGPKTKKKVRQINFIVKAKNSQIRLDPKEHVEYVWVGKNDYQKLPMTPEIKQCLSNLFLLN